MTWYMSQDDTLHNMMPTPSFSSLLTSTLDAPKKVSPSHKYKLLYYKFIIFTVS